MTYYFNKTLNISFEDAISKVTEELKKDGFGILTDIDVQETLKKKHLSSLNHSPFHFCH